MTWLIGTIVNVVDADTFDVNVERSGGPYASSLRSGERIRMCNREVNALRPDFMTQFQYGMPSLSLIGKKVYCEIHSRSQDLQLVVTARPM